MDLTDFYAVISGINFTLLGLWWVAVRERKELSDAAGRRLGYLRLLIFLGVQAAWVVSMSRPKETPS